MSRLMIRNERKNKVKAFVVTIVICVGAFSAVTMDSDQDMTALLPDALAEMFFDKPVDTVENTEVANTDSPRP